MENRKSNNRDKILAKLNELEALLKRQNEQPLNFNQAAEYLGFSHSYLYKLTSKKNIPCHRPTGKMLFFSKYELDDWVFCKRNNKEDVEQG